MAKMPRKEDGRVGTIHYQYLIFESYIEPHGALAVNKESHACFYYAMLATKARLNAPDDLSQQVIQYKIGDAIPLWREQRDEELARSVATIYGFDNPGEFLKPEWKKRAWAQAKALGVDVPVAVLNVSPRKKLIH